MARYTEIILATEVPIYWHDPRSPWQRGTNENTNGLLRSISPRAPTCPPTVPVISPRSPTNSNTLPRETLGWDTPAQALAKLLAG